MTPSDQLASVQTKAAPRHSHVVEGFIVSNSESVAATLTVIIVELSDMSKYPTGSAVSTLCSHADEPANASVQRFAANFGGEAYDAEIFGVKITLAAEGYAIFADGTAL